MLQRLKEHINANLSFLEGKKLLIACSGGVDSVVLCNLLKSLNFKFSIAHCNFLLRGDDSNLDAAFVEELADKLSVPFFIRSFETENYANSKLISIQMAARELRYEWFDELCKEQAFDYVLTAHHLDDDLETFFINLSR